MRRPQRAISEVWSRVTSTVVERGSWNFQKTYLSYVPTKRISRIFYFGDLRSGHFSDLPIISQWGKIQLPLKAIQITQNVQKHGIIGLYWWFNRKMSSTTSSRCSRGHLRSPEVASGFSAITFDWIEISTRGSGHSICLIKTDRMMYTMAIVGSGHDLTWGQIFKLTFWGQTIYHWMRLNELITMVGVPFFYRI